MVGWMTYKGLELPDGPVGEPGDNLANDLKLLADGMGGSGLPISADSYVIAPRGANDIESADNLRTGYAAAKLLTPGGNTLSATNRGTCFVLAGRYDFGTGDSGHHGLVLDADFVDLIGLSTARADAIITSQIATASRGTIEQTASDVTIANMTLEITGSGSVGSGDTIPSAYFPNSNLPDTQLSNIRFLDTNIVDRYGMRKAIEYSGRYIDCVAGDGSFGNEGTASGTFINCESGIFGFGSNIGGVASGIFIDCRGGANCFASWGGLATGTFNNCIAGDASFGSYGGEARGTFSNCIAGATSFGGSATIVDGTFTNCIGGSGSFGGSNGVAQGTFINCRLGTSNSLGVTAWGGTFLGLMQNCHWKVTGSNETALRVSTGARIYDSTLIAAGTGKSIDAPSAVNAVIAHCRLNKGIGTNVTNLIGTPYNVNDSNIS